MDLTVEELTSLNDEDKSLHTSLNLRKNYRNHDKL